VSAIGSETGLGSRLGRSFRFARLPSARVGIAVGSLILLVVAVGPLFAPHTPSQPLGVPYAPPSRDAILGLDFLGRDVLSRLLWGGRSVVGLAVAATIIAYAAGIAVGLVAGYSRTWLDGVLMRATDVLLAFPPLLFLLVVATGAGHSTAALVIAIAITHVGGIARIVRTATLEVSTLSYVEAAVVRGERAASVLRREILPNILDTVLADAGIRLTGSILLLASVNYLGLGLQPPRADWALMISENRSGLNLNPWAIIAPAALIALLTISVNLVADATARSLGKSTDTTAVAR
jgi:peptide/nickel transport system permease protein